MDDDLGCQGDGTAWKHFCFSGGMSSRKYQVVSPFPPFEGDEQRSNAFSSFRKGNGVLIFNASSFYTLAGNFEEEKRRPLLGRPSLS